MRRLIPPRLALLALAHFTIDAYSSFFSPLLPLLVTRLHMNLTNVGTLVAIASLASSFSQPIFGWLSDRVHRPWFVAFGPLIAGVFLSAIGLAPTYATLVTLLVLGGLGVSAFHPQGAGISGGLMKKRSVAMSFFVSGGTLGFSVGPLIAVGITGRYGLEHSWYAVVLGIVVSGLLLSQFPRLNPHPRHSGPRPALSELKPVARPLTLLYFAVVCRSAVSYGFMSFLPLYLHARGWTVAAAGGVLSTYLLAGAIGGFLGGWLSERWGGRRIVRGSFLGAAPLYVAFLFLPDAIGLPALVLGGFLLQASLPVNVVLGQELSPRHSSTISSLLMGAAWGVGALLIGPVGAIADARGLHTALLTLTSLLIGGFACAMALPRQAAAAAVPADIAQPGFAGAGE